MTETDLEGTDDAESEDAASEETDSNGELEIHHMFMRVSEQAINSLLIEYNSVEEAFQDLRCNESVASPSEPETETEQASNADDGRVHTEIQWYLVQLGQQHGYDVHVAITDKNRTYQGERLGEDCLEELVLPGFSDAVTNIIRYVDVIWLEGDAIVAMLEVESTTSIYSGIVRITDFVTRMPNFAVDMYIVAAESDSDAVRKEITRPTFETVLEPVSHSSLQFLSFEDVRESTRPSSLLGRCRKCFESSLEGSIQPEPNRGGETGLEVRRLP